MNTPTPAHCAVIGHPIAHSLSPQIHHAFAHSLGLNVHYERILSEIPDFERTVQDFFARGGHGLNVTVPFKERAFALAAHSRYRKSTRLNSSHVAISYAVFCLKKATTRTRTIQHVR